MDPKLATEIARQIADAVFLEHWLYWGVLACVVVVLSAAAGYFGAYWKARGSHYATKADFANLLDQLEKTTRLTESIRSELQGRSHKENTVFSRLDKERSDAILAIDASLREFGLHRLYFTLYHPFDAARRAEPPLTSAMTWGFILLERSKTTLEITIRKFLLLDPELGVMLSLGWHNLARGLGQAYMAEFIKLMNDAKFQALAAEEQRAVLNRIKDTTALDVVARFDEIGRKVTAKLKQEFEKTDRT